MEEVDKHIAAKLNGGKIIMSSPATTILSVSLRKMMGGWIKRNKWWFTGLVLVTGFTVTGWVWIPFGMHLGVAVFNISAVVAVLTGRTRRTRVCLLLVGAVISVVVGVCLQAILGFPAGDSVYNGAMYKTLWGMIIMSGSDYY